MGWTTGESGFDSAGSEGGAEIFLVSITNANQLMLFRGIIPVYSENHTKHTTASHAILRMNSDFPLCGNKCSLLKMEQRNTCSFIVDYVMLSVARLYSVNQ
jgi:hypothetical protein